jgi:hypothetical protein
MQSHALTCASTRTHLHLHAAFRDHAHLACPRRAQDDVHGKLAAHILLQAGGACKSTLEFNFQKSAAQLMHPMLPGPHVVHGPALWPAASQTFRVDEDVFARHGADISAFTAASKVTRLVDGGEHHTSLLISAVPLDRPEIDKRLAILREWHATLHGNAGAIAVAALARLARRQTTHVTSVCGACGAHGAVQLCSRCKDARYCDRKCQANHWPQHKAYCKAAAKALAAAAAAAVAASVSPSESPASSAAAAAFSVPMAATAATTATTGPDMTAGESRRHWHLLCHQKDASAAWSSLESAGSSARAAALDFYDVVSREERGTMTTVVNCIYRNANAGGVPQVLVLVPQGLTDSVEEGQKMQETVFTKQLDVLKPFMLHVSMQLKREVFVQVACRAWWRQWRVSADKSGAIPDGAVWTQSDRRLPLDLRAYTFKAS